MVAASRPNPEPRRELRTIAEGKALVLCKEKSNCYPGDDNRLGEDCRCHVAGKPTTPPPDQTADYHRRR